MSKGIQVVAVAGATGNTGPAVIQALLAAGFDVKALTRSASGAQRLLDQRAKVVQVDYHNQEGLVEALKGVDAVVVCGVGMLPEQTNLIDAAITAGVSRFMPAGFGADIRDPAMRAVRINKDKVATDEYLKAREDKISHTTIATGPLFDWVIARGVLINMTLRSQQRYNDGEKRFSTTTIDTAAKAVAAALKLGDETKNRTLLVHDLVITQNQLLGWGQDLDPDANWQVTVVDTEELARLSEKALQRDSRNRMALNMQRGATVFGKESRSDFGEGDMKELGLEMMTEERAKNFLGGLIDQIWSPVQQEASFPF